MSTSAARQLGLPEAFASGAEPIRARPAPVVIPISLLKLPGRPINLDNCFVAVDNLPFGVRLTAGVTNDESTWLLTPRQMEEVALVVPSPETDSFNLSVRIVMLDPDGYDFATTIARFDVLARVEPGPRGMAPPVELDFRRFCGGAAGWFEARFGTTEVPTLRLVDSEDELVPGGQARGEAAGAEPRLGVIEQMIMAARVEWEAEENARFARAQEQWQELEDQRRAIQNTEADDRLSRLLAEAEERWQVKESERLFIAELAWQTAENERIAAHDVRWHAKMAQVYSVLASRGIEIPPELLDVHLALTGAALPLEINPPRHWPKMVREWRWAAAIVLAAGMTALLSF
ncbi:MAG: hypothetical protein ACKVOI_04540 [Dongiaceae bacterium]